MVAVVECSSQYTQLCDLRYYGRYIPAWPKGQLHDVPKGNVCVFLWLFSSLSFLLYFFTYLLGYLSRGRYCGRKFQVVHLMIASSFSLSLEKKSQDFLSLDNSSSFSLPSLWKTRKKSSFNNLFFFFLELEKLDFTTKWSKSFRHCRPVRTCIKLMAWWAFIISKTKSLVAEVLILRVIRKSTDSYMAGYFKNKNNRKQKSKMDRTWSLWGEEEIVKEPRWLLHGRRTPLLRSPVLMPSHIFKKKRAALKEEEKRPGTKCLVNVISPSYKKTCAVIAQELGSLLVMWVEQR